jgi:HEAT repeat protein
LGERQLQLQDRRRQDREDRRIAIQIDISLDVIRATGHHVMRATELAAPAGSVTPGISTNRSVTSHVVCAALREQLRHGIDTHRCLAAQALGQIGSTDSIQALIAALLDEDEDVRSDAAAALTQRAPVEAGTQLMENLIGDPVREVKLHAIDALARMRHPDLAPWLRRIARQRCADINWSGPETQGGWDDWADVQIKAIETLAALDCEEAVPDILAAIKDEFGQDLTGAGFAALARLGAPGTEALSGFVDHENSRWRRRAAVLLGETAPDAVDQSDDQVASDPGTEDRHTALKELVRDQGGEAVASLREMVADPERQVRLMALAMLGELATQADWPNAAAEALLLALAGALVAPSEVRAEVQADVQTVDAAGPSDNADAPQDVGGSVPTSTLDAIVHASIHQPAPVETDRTPDLPRETLELLRLAERAPRKRRVAADQDYPAYFDVPRCAARILGDVPHIDVARALTDKLADDDAEMRRAAADSLARLAAQMGTLPEETTVALETRLCDAETDRDVRLLAVRALGCARTEAALPQLIATLDDPDNSLRAEAVRAIAGRHRTQDGIVRLMEDSDASVRLAAAEALAASPDRDNVGRLVDFAFAHGGFHRQDATRLLRGIDPVSASEGFLAVLRDNGRRLDWSVAIEALGAVNARDP